MRRSSRVMVMKWQHKVHDVLLCDVISYFLVGFFLSHLDVKMNYFCLGCYYRRHAGY